MGRIVQAAEMGPTPVPGSAGAGPPQAQTKQHARKPSLTDVLGQGNPQRLGLPKRESGVAQMLEDWVKAHGGNRPIHSILVANNGLAAVKFMRSVRSWASQTLGNPRAISFLAMATPNDMRINAEHISLADQFVEVPGGTNNNNYANVSLIVQVAQRAGVDAVWPGWGHASENPDLPAALAERGIVFLGPPSGAMAALGDKIGSSILAQAAGVPTLPWSGSGVAVSYAECDGVIPDETYAKACVSDVDEAVAACARIGYPVMLKASWGGGGKGIRKVSTDAEVRSVYRQVAGEVPGSPIFAMKLAPLSRHLEVQLLCDTHGNVASLMSRDCSVQRRHQKIIEEGPVTAAPPDTLAAMERCARALARSVGYVGAATVEFLYSVEEGKHYFLELNPRLQVEHPVTEGITGVNIPACQVMVGMGLPLWRIAALRTLFGQDPAGDTPFDVDNTPQKAPDCHVVAVRITAEDAADGFKPTAGRIDELFFRPTPEVWGYFSVKSGGAIHEYSDSQFGHLFAKGGTRQAALRSLAVALRDVVVRGEIRTIVDYALDMLQSPDLINNQIHTGWLDSRIARKVPGVQAPWHIAVIAGAAVRAHQAVSAQSIEYLGFLSKGQLPPASVSLISFKESLIIGGTKYLVEVVRRGPTAFCVTLNGSKAEVTTRKMADGGFLMQVDGESHVVHVEEEAAGTRLAVGPATCLLAKEADPSRLVAGSPGKLIRYLVTPGSHVQAHQPYAEVEVMKMMMPLLAPAAGVVSFLLPEGAVMNAGDVIGRLGLDDPHAVVRAEVFTGTFPELGPPVLPSARPDHRLRAALEAAENILAGYDQPVERVAAELVTCLDSPALALGQWEDEMAVVRARLPPALVAQLDALTSLHEEAIQEVQQVADMAAAAGASATSPTTLPLPLSVPEFPAAQLQAVMNQTLQESLPAERGALTGSLHALLELTNKHMGGKEAYARRVVQDLLQRFLEVEEKFRLGGSDGPGTEQEAIDTMRKAAAPVAVLDAVVSHQGLSRKCDLVSRLLATLVLPGPTHYRAQLRGLAALAGSVKGTATLAARAAALLEHSLLGDLRVVVARALSGLDMFSATDPDPSTHTHTAPRRSTGDSDKVSAAANDEQSTTAGPTGTAAGPASAAGGGGGGGGGGENGGGAVRRSITNMEGVFLGLPPHLLGGAAARSGGGGAAPHMPTVRSGVASPLGGAVSPRITLPNTGPGAAVSRVATAAVETKMEMLVTVPAAVEDALASLVVDNAVELHLKARAALTLVRRLHQPFMLNDASLTTLPAGDLMLTWLYEEPGDANTPAPRARIGVLLVLASLTTLPGLLEGAVTHALEDLGPHPVTLHIAITGDSEAPMHLLSDTHTPGVIELTQDEELLGSAADQQLLSDNAMTLFKKGVSAVLGQCRTRLLSQGCDTAYLMTRSRTGTLPLRLGYHLQQSSSSGGAVQPAGHTQDAAVFRRDRFLSQVDPTTGSLLELVKLSPYKGLHYAPSRNRQYHLYTATERPDARSYPVRRLYVRGIVRQLTSPALLAASYGGHPTAIATAVIEELESNLLGALDEVVRLQKRAGELVGGGAAAQGANAAGGPADWVHIFCNVLPAVPLSGSGGLGVSFGGAVGGGTRLGDSGSVAGGGRAGEYEGRVAAALRVAVAGLVAKHSTTIRQAAVACIELRLRPSGREPAWRLLVSLPTGHEYGEEHVVIYRERAPTLQDTSWSKERVYAPLASQPTTQDKSLTTSAASVSASEGSSSSSTELNAAAALLGQPVLAPYPALHPLQQRRLAARRHNVTYCYDFPTVFETALRGIWRARAAAGEPNSAIPAGRLVEAEELVVAEPLSVSGSCTAYRGPVRLTRVTRPAGRNECGMVAWVLTLRTPECPQGRQVVAVANDLTFQSGAFSPREDALFRGAAELSLEERLPLVYLAANSGARVGLAVEVRDRLQVEWVDPNDPTQGFNHLYLTDADYKHLQDMATKQGKQIVKCTASRQSDGSTRWLLSDVVGCEDGLGVECLSGSGAIAQAFNKAFREGYTITLVSGRTVGIGAYLARLGRRCVQRADQPIILTGYAALNKLLGRPVYSSHMQLGGPRVMAANGVSTQVVSDDLEGVRTILDQLSYCPPLLLTRGSSGAPAHPSLPTADPLDRAIGYAPAPGAKLDPHAAVAGRAGAAGEWQSGLFDKGSWVESYTHWARTVVTGRARLGGIPVGVIAVETQTVVRHQPADPGMPDSTEQHLPQAGQVWYPDSALKTAASIEEFDLEGLPLVILANWRGFSGGQRDLFDGVLQAGSQIVEALRTYRHPVTVYIPCNAELRGGAWVVVDACISSVGSIEMFADPSARGGVLEPEGVVEIKFRTPDLLKLMHRTDKVLMSLKAEAAAAATPGAAAAAAADSSAPPAAADSHTNGPTVEQRIKAREKQLLPVYQQVARSFADMHDTPVRMLAKGVLQGIVPWHKARTFLGLRLRRRLMEAQLAGHVATTDPSLPRSEALELVRSWHAASLTGGTPTRNTLMATISSPIEPSPVRSHTAPRVTTSAQGADHAHSHAALVEADEHLADLISDDVSFLEWAESGAGRAALAAELRALRTRAATALVCQVLQSQEGREGLLAALSASIGADPGLAVQLRALLSRGSSSNNNLQQLALHHTQPS